MLSEKKLAKIEKALGKDTLAEIDAQPVDALKDTLVSAEHSIMEAARELESNEKYQEIKESLKVLSSGLREVKGRQNAIIAYVLHRLEESGSK